MHSACVDFAGPMDEQHHAPRDGSNRQTEYRYQFTFCLATNPLWPFSGPSMICTCAPLSSVDKT